MTEKKLSKINKEGFLVLNAMFPKKVYSLTLKRFTQYGPIGFVNENTDRCVDYSAEAHLEVKYYTLSTVPHLSVSYGKCLFFFLLHCCNVCILMIKC